MKHKCPICGDEANYQRFKKDIDGVTGEVSRCDPCLYYLIHYGDTFVTRTGTQRWEWTYITAKSPVVEIYAAMAKARAKLNK